MLQAHAKKFANESAASCHLGWENRIPFGDHIRDGNTSSHCRGVALPFVSWWRLCVLMVPYVQGKCCLYRSVEWRFPPTWPSFALYPSFSPSRSFSATHTYNHVSLFIQTHINRKFIICVNIHFYKTHIGSVSVYYDHSPAWPTQGPVRDGQLVESVFLRLEILEVFWSLFYLLSLTSSSWTCQLIIFTALAIKGLYIYIGA